MLDGNGQPTSSTPAIVRFSNVAGHFSTWAVVISTASDATPPQIALPADITVEATGPNGAPVTYAGSVVDNLDPSPVLACAPASGSVFPVGTTVVTCTATDHSKNAVTATFNVRVRGAVGQIVSLIDKTRLYLDLPLLQAALKARLEEAGAALLQKSTVAACRALNLYIAAVTRMPSSQLSAAERSELIADADRIKVVIGC